MAYKERMVILVLLCILLSFIAYASSGVPAPPTTPPSMDTGDIGPGEGGSLPSSDLPPDPLSPGSGQSGNKSTVSSADMTKISEELAQIKQELEKQSKTINGLNTGMATLQKKLGEKPSPLYGTYFIIALIVIGVLVICLLFIFFMKKSEPKEKNKAGKPANTGDYNDASKVILQTIRNGSQMNIARINSLRRYISVNAAKGYNPTLIRQSLFKQGYSSSEIEFAFRNRY